MNDDNILHIYTDGACKGNPGIGGWGALLCYGPHQKTLNGAAALTTNNRMELTAAIEALRAVKRACPIVISTDSSYLKNGITQWLAGWKRNGWKTGEEYRIVAGTGCTGQPVSNRMALGEGA